MNASFSYVLALPGRATRKLRYIGQAALAALGARIARRAARTRAAWRQTRDRQRARRANRQVLEANAGWLLAGTGTLDLPSSDDPTLSVVLDLCAEPAADLFALQGLAALGRGLAGEERVEVLLVGPPAAPCLERVRGVAAVVAAEPGVYLRLARQARGGCLLFLGGGVRLLDASDEHEPLAGSDGAASARAALRRLRSSGPDGTVTGRLVGADGRLLSAGLVMEAAGGPVAPYAAGLPASAPVALFGREVDGGDADALFVAREAFLRLGGFGPADDPARSGAERGAAWGGRVRQDGSRVVYEPAVLAHKPRPAGRPAREAARRRAGRLSGRDRRKSLARVLLVEDQVPYPWLGAGYPRSAELLAALVAANCAVTLYPALQAAGSWTKIRALVDPRVEVMLGWDWMDFPRFWRERAGFYDLCIVCRPHNMARLRRCLFGRPFHPPVVYDAEALVCLRTLAWRRLILGKRDSAAYARRLVAREVGLARGSAAVLSVSEREAGRFREFLADGGNGSSGPRLYLLRHTTPIRPTPADFHERRGFLFVGTLHSPGTPNADAVEWFLREIFPLLGRAAGQEPPVFRVAGTNLAGLDYSTHPGVEMLGRVDDLDPVYNRARVFVAPTRFSAGVPLKVYEAAGRGLPVVLTPLLAEQLDWRAGDECLVAGDAPAFADACQRLYGDRALWEHLRANALRRVEADCSAEGFRATVERVVVETLHRTHLSRQAP